MKRHIIGDTDRTACGRAAVLDRDVDAGFAHHATCTTCKRALAAHIRRETKGERQKIGRLSSVDGMERLPSDARASLRRKTMRVVR